MDCESSTATGSHLEMRASPAMPCISSPETMRRFVSTAFGLSRWSLLRMVLISRRKILRLKYPAHYGIVLGITYTIQLPGLVQVWLHSVLRASRTVRRQKHWSLDVEFRDVIRRAIASYVRFGRAQHHVRVAEERTNLTLEYPTRTSHGMQLTTCRSIPDHNYVLATNRWSRLWSRAYYIYGSITLPFVYGRLRPVGNSPQLDFKIAT